MAKWPDIMSGEKFCVILRPAIYFQKSYIKQNLDGGTSTPEKLCWGISCASLFLPLFRGLNHACENGGFCTISTRTHTGFPVSQILMRKGHKSPRFGEPLGGTAWRIVRILRQYGIPVIQQWSSVKYEWSHHFSFFYLTQKKINAIFENSR